MRLGQGVHISFSKLAGASTTQQQQKPNVALAKKGQPTQDLLPNSIVSQSTQ
jgi:hypothetical protein